jgi:sigma-E factor negative regulatory protein RseA
VVTGDERAGAESKMSEHLNKQDEVRSRMSALMDGELDGNEARRMAALWRTDADARAAWHAYHLAGDVLRSSDLACAPARDEAFLQRLRDQMAAEPVVLAPEVQVEAGFARARARRAWLAPAAVAAGFVAVAGVLVVMRAQAPVGDGGSSVLAGGAVPASGSVVVPVNTVAPVAAANIVVDGRVIRDAGLDVYLSAHRRLGSAASLAAPGPRAVEAVAVEGK